MICRLCGLEAETDENTFNKNLRGAGMKPMGRYCNVDDGEL